MKRDSQFQLAHDYGIAERNPAPAGTDLSVIIPTFNEVGNVDAVVAALHRALHGLSWEVMFVDDDSTDGTLDRLTAIARADARVRVLRRIGRRGLASACIEGMLATTSPMLAVMDADLQHDELLLAPMLSILHSGQADIVVGTRYAQGGSCGLRWHPWRQRLSAWATSLTRRFMKVSLSDPMSGFFMLRRPVLEATLYTLSNLGFKTLLDLVMSSPTPQRVVELPYDFRCRQAGQSKLDLRVGWDFLMLLLDKKLGCYVPLRVLGFAVVGSVGVVTNLGILKAMLGFGMSFTAAQSIAVAASMAGNFVLNNALTYADRRLVGSAAVWGLLKFMLACSVGTIANVGVASMLYADRHDWFWSGLAGIALGIGWNFIATSLFVWSPSRRCPTARA